MCGRFTAVFSHEELADCYGVAITACGSPMFINSALTMPWALDQNALFFRALAAFVDDSFLLTGFAAEELFINFDDTADSGEVLMAHVHHFADRVAKLPGRFLVYTEPPTNEDGGHSLAGMNHVVHAKNPDPQREFRAVQRGLCGNRELAPTRSSHRAPGGTTFDSPRL